jgi:hypothetical protein
MRDIFVSAGDEVVDAQDIPAAREHGVAEMRAEKSRAAGDYRAHKFALRVESR